MSQPESLKLPPEGCDLGYTEAQITEILGDDHADFQHWMRGQTMSICEGRLYNHDAKQWEPSGCGPHGPVVYARDLRHYLARLERRRAARVAAAEEQPNG